MLGLDGAVAYTFLARAVSIVGSTGRCLLIVRFLTPIEQGYYYTLLSLVSLQVVFEMGFSFVIQQLAAHECVHLEIAGGWQRERPACRPSAAGLGASSSACAGTRWPPWRWVSILAPLGMLFFARHAGQAGAAQVAWQADPGSLAVAASMAGLWCVPFYSFRGWLRRGARGGLDAAAPGSGSRCAGLVGHAAASRAVRAGPGHRGPCGRRAVLSGFASPLCWRVCCVIPARASAIQWKQEVWPFQWRIAVSWMCSYFTVQVFIPILFALRGPVEAGQMGMSLSITGYMTILALAWILDQGHALRSLDRAARLPRA
jgi:hypothetical protein